MSWFLRQPLWLQMVFLGVIEFGIVFLAVSAALMLGK